MRLGEECPYITPCGWCSRQGKPCEAKHRKKESSHKIAAASDDQIKAPAQYLAPAACPLP